jgi:hypothetical protein
MKTNSNLWWKLSEFSLDVPEIDFSFSDRLARENGWSKEFTNRVIEEYKKFVFLSVTSGKALTPSDEVDQAWHLHMIYSRSYWDEMCMGILNGFKLYHGPTKGGKAEASRFNEQYLYTLKLYSEIFGQLPPSDIWPSVEKRFSPMNWKRVDVAKNIVLSKQKVKEYMISYVAPVAGAFVISLFTGSTSKTEDSNFWWWVLGVAVAIFVIRGIYRYLNRHERRSGSSSSSGSSYDSGCTVIGSFFGCGSGDSGCGSSGCSSSGCSGCGGGGCSGCGGCGS